jgi:hypothetical protein
MKNHISEAVTAIKSEIARLEHVLAALGDGAVPTKAPVAVSRMPMETSANAAKPPRRRKRRSSYDVKKQAQDMVDFIQSKGKTGATTAEIVKRFGKVLPSIKAFITPKVDAEIKTIGAGRATVYVIN